MLFLLSHIDVDLIFIFRSDRRCVHDRIGRTIVVESKIHKLSLKSVVKASNLFDLILSKEFKFRIKKSLNFFIALGAAKKREKWARGAAKERQGGARGRGGACGGGARTR